MPQLRPFKSREQGLQSADGTFFISVTSDSFHLQMKQGESPTTNQPEGKVAQKALRAVPDRAAFSFTAPSLAPPLLPKTTEFAHLFTAIVRPFPSDPSFREHSAQIPIPVTVPAEPGVGCIKNSSCLTDESLNASPDGLGYCINVILIRDKRRGHPDCGKGVREAVRAQTCT
jgi:hypothetical protein